MYLVSNTFLTLFPLPYILPSAIKWVLDPVSF